MARAFWITVVPLLAVALALTTMFADSIPGLHADEAWAMLRVHETAAGQLWFKGQSYYTGALNQVLAWPFLEASGYQPWGLRLAGATSNAVAVLFALATVRALHPTEPTIWRWTGALLVTSVPFVVFARFGIELTMLGPLLVFAALWLLTVATRVPACGVVAGVILGLAVYNHVVLGAVVAATGTGALAGFGRSVFRHRLTWLVAAGLCVGLTPTAFQFLAELRREPAVAAATAPAAAPDETAGNMLASLGDLGLDIVSIPVAFAGMVDGGLMFQRVTGERLVPVIPYVSLVLLGLGGLCAWRMRWTSLRPIDRAMLVGWLAMPVMALLIAPQLSLRFLELPALAASYALVRFARSAPRLGRGVLAAVLVLQVGYVTTDYFWAYARSGGRLGHFPLGARLTENSNHFVRTDRLYRQLVAAGVREVIADQFIVLPLKAYDIPFRRLDIRRFEPGKVTVEAAAPRVPAGPTAVIAYGIRGTGGTDHLGALLDAGDLSAGEFRYVRASGFDPNFVVFLSGQQRP